MIKNILKKSFIASLLLVALMFASSSSVNAQDVRHVRKALCFTLKDGSQIKFLFSSLPVFTFSGDKCKVESEDINAEYAMTDILGAELLALSGVKDNVTEVIVDMSDPGKAVLSGLEPGSDVAVYDLNGVMICSAKADAEGYVNMSFDSLAPKKIYILSTSKTSFKFYRK